MKFLDLFKVTGPPLEFRHSLWMTLSMCLEYDGELYLENPKPLTMQKILKLFAVENQEVDHIVSKDVPRTLGDMLFFSEQFLALEDSIAHNISLTNSPLKLRKLSTEDDNPLVNVG